MEKAQAAEHDPLSECRVCRGESTLERPLVSPCLCRGSISFVHQDCLEHWLTHSNKDACELCSSKYLFEPQYQNDAPDNIPIHLFLKSTLKRLFFVSIPFTFRFILTVALWLIVVPLSTSWLYRIWMRSTIKSTSMIKHRINLEVLKLDVISGIVLTSAIIVSFIILMSFADFLRFHWAPDVPDDGLANEQPLVAAGGAAAGGAGGAGGVGGVGGVGGGVDGGAAPAAPAAPAAAAGGATSTEVPVVEQKEKPLPREGNDITPSTTTTTTKGVAAAASEGGNSYFATAESTRPASPAANALNSSRNTRSLDEEFELQRTAEIPHSLSTRSNEERASAAAMPSSSSFSSSSASSSSPSSSSSSSCTSHSSQNTETKPGMGEEVVALYDQESSSDDGGHLLDDDEDEEGDFLDEFNEFDDAFEPADGGGEGGVHHADMEVHVALDELLGLRGPLHLLLRNVLWLLAFNTMYVGLFASIPYTIGTVVGKALSQQPLFQYCSTFLQYAVPAAAHEMISKIVLVSAQTDSTLQLFDAFVMCLGYIAVFMTIFFVDSAVSWLHWRSSGHYLTIFVEVLSILSSVVKVGCLLFLRIFILPICLGSAILVASNTLLDYTMDAWVSFMTSNIVGAFALAWAIGISYMLTVTLSVLQLREVLHPDILAHIIRPQEAHLDLLHSLMHESAFTHIRRICLSMVVYLVLLTLLVYTPIKCCQLLGLSTVFQVRVWYLFPEIQLPLEIAMGHVTFLTVLEKKKNIFGRLQFAWLITTSKMLGITRLLLPMPMKKVTGGTGVAIDAHGTPLVGRPLRRPPNGWDARTYRSTTRWAWGTEEPSDVQKSVAPRVVPKNWLQKTALLVLLSWLLVIVIVVTVVAAPLFAGRFIFAMLQVPLRARHDPLCFLIGTAFCAFLLILVRKADWVSLRHLYDSLGNMPTRVATRLKFFSFKCLTIELAIGIFFEIWQMNSITSLFSLSTLSRAICLGGTFLGVVGGFIFSGFLDALAARIGVNNPLEAWQTTMQHAFTRCTEALHDGHWDVDALQVRVFEQNLVNPSFEAFFWGGLLPTMLSALICSVFHVGSTVCPLVFIREQQDLTLDEAAVHAVKVTTLILSVFWSLYVLLMPLRSWLNILYSHVRDENYLIGRRLRAQTE